MAQNEKYSYKSYPYHGLSFKDQPAGDFDNSEIIGSGFYQEYVEGDASVVKDIFPTGMTGVTFKDCNLDNVLVPTGNTVDGGTNKNIKVQNDLEDWFVDGSDEPIEPLMKEMRDKAKISSLPKDIPRNKWTAEQRLKYEQVQKQRIDDELPATTRDIKPDDILKEIVRDN